MVPLMLVEPKCCTVVQHTVVDQVLEAKVLGVTFDHHLSWEQHVDSLCCKLNSRRSLLRRISASLHKKAPCIITTLVFTASLFIVLAPGAPAPRHYSFVSFACRNMLLV